MKCVALGEVGHGRGLGDLEAERAWAQVGRVDLAEDEVEEVLVVERDWPRG